MLVSQKFALDKKLKTGLAHVRPTLNDYAIPENTGYDKNRNAMSRKRKYSETSTQYNDIGDFSNDKKVSIVSKSGDKSSVTGVFKNNENGKPRKMGISKIKQCYNVLKTLMTHPSGWVFNQPVDPIKLQIPDYFSIITNPMDLGTIKDRLERKYYINPDEFAADVNLTFSNATRYNPPGNSVHEMAKDLNNVFIAKWKSLGSKWRKESRISSQPEQVVVSKQFLQRVPSCKSSSLLSRCLTTADILKLVDSLKKFSRRNCPPQLLRFLQKVGMLEQSEERISINIYALNEEALLELHQIVKSTGNAVPTNATRLMKKSQGLTNECNKGTNATGVKTGSNNSMTDTITTASTKGSQPCVNTDYTSGRPNKIKQDSSSDGSEKSSARCTFTSSSIVSKLDDKVPVGYDKSYTTNGKATAIAHADKVQNTLDTSSPVASTPIKEPELPCEELSPARALRAAMLRSRFADTIFMAEQKTLKKNHGDKCDPKQMQREMEKLKRQQQEEKERIEAEIKAAEAAVRTKAETERKLQREKEREAARLALQEMEKTIDFYENSSSFNYLQNLVCSQPPPDDVNANFMDLTGKQSPLARLGLFIKDDDDSDYEFEDIEDGEIS